MKYRGKDVELTHQENEEAKMRTLLKIKYGGV